MVVIVSDLSLTSIVLCTCACVCRPYAGLARLAVLVKHKNKSIKSHTAVALVFERAAGPQGKSGTCTCYFFSLSKHGTNGGGDSVFAACKLLTHILYRQSAMVGKIDTRRNTFRSINMHGHRHTYYAYNTFSTHRFSHTCFFFGSNAFAFRLSSTNGRRQQPTIWQHM